MKIISTKHGRFLICNEFETIQQSLVTTGQFELNLVKMAAEILKKKMGCIVDVGANIGIFTVPIAMLNRDRNVFSFEPQRNVFHHLCSNIVLNQLSNVCAEKLAIGEESNCSLIEVPTFDIFKEKYTGSVSLDKDVINLRSEIPGVAEPDNYAEKYDKVMLECLDNLIKDVPVALIKVDVEGMELSALSSGKDLIKEFSPALLFEAWDLEKFREQNDLLFDYVSKFGYRIWRFGNDCVALHYDDEDIATTLEFLENKDFLQL